MLLLGGCPPLPFLVRGSPCLHLLQAVRWERSLVLVVCPPSYAPWLRAGGSRYLVVVSFSIP